MILCFDTETNGLPDYKAPSDAPHQPHMVQFGAVLCHLETGEELHAVKHLVRPDGWEISPEMTAIHGISQEQAMAEGIPEADVAAVYWELVHKASMRVAFNLAFDDRIMRSALLRAGKDRGEIDALKDAPKFCAMQGSRKLVNLAPTDKMMAAGFKTAKNPNLSEAYQFFFDEELMDAHTALADCRACARIFFHIRQKVPLV
jgi:DNA polymerase III subunit epsilon